MFTYPVLQTADIILYKATHVPVGKRICDCYKTLLELAKDELNLRSALNRRDLSCASETKYSFLINVLSRINDRSY